MTKEDLITAVAEKAGITKTAANDAITATVDAITDALGRGDKVTLVGFGTFEVRERAAREGRNPQTGAKIQVAAKKAPAFSAGKTLKDRVAGAKK